MKRFSRSRIQRTNPYHIRYSQNFIKTRRLAVEIVRLCHFQKTDVVIEIGPGKGALTEHIINHCGKLLAIEKDKDLHIKLSESFSEQSNIEFINQDFLKFQLPLNKNYKVVGNIPFALTSEIFRKLLEAPNPPIEITLIIQREAALRLTGSRNSENLFSMRYKPWFESRVIMHLHKSDFYPIPSVEVSVINIKKREPPIIPKNSKAEYLKFLTYCFTSWKQDIRHSLKNFFTYKQLVIISRNNGINLNKRPTEIKFEEWIELFEVYLKFGRKE
ncbi:MAG: 23S ribosomal RNA methyltransferase Erm [Candidatus Dojkabacteria bacterium]